MIIDVYTDGSSQNNGKANCTGGWAMVIPDFQGKKYIRYGNLAAPSSNNKAEAMGVYMALMLFSGQSKYDLRIYSDSKYVINTMTEWREKRKKEVYFKNQQLFTPMFNLFEKSACKINLCWLKGHAGNPGNEAADLYAGLGQCRNVRDAESQTLSIKYIDSETLLSKYRVDTTYEVL